MADVLRRFEGSAGSSRVGVGVVDALVHVHAPGKINILGSYEIHVVSAFDGTHTTCTTEVRKRGLLIVGDTHELATLKNPPLAIISGNSIFS